MELFICAIVQAAGLVLNHKYIDDDYKRIVILSSIVAPSLIWGLASWCYLFVHRLNHEGEVCSGDFLGYNASHEGYLINTGLFIIFFWRIAVFGIIGGGLTAVCFGLCYGTDYLTNRDKGPGIHGSHAIMFFVYVIPYLLMSCILVVIFTVFILGDLSILFR